MFSTANVDRATKRQLSPEGVSSSSTAASIHTTTTSPSPTPPPSSAKSSNARVIRSLLTPFKRMRDTLTRRVKHYGKNANNSNNELDDSDRALIQEVREALNAGLTLDYDVDVTSNIVDKDDKRNDLIEQIEAPTPNNYVEADTELGMGYEADRECLSRSASPDGQSMAITSTTVAPVFHLGDRPLTIEFFPDLPCQSVPARPTPTITYVSSNVAANDMFSYFTDKRRADDIGVEAAGRPTANPIIHDPNFDVSAVPVSPVPLQRSVSVYHAFSSISAGKSLDSFATPSRKRSHNSANDGDNVSEDSDSDPEPPARPRKYRRTTVDGKIYARIDGPARLSPPKAPTWDGGYKADVSDSDRESILSAMKDLKVKKAKKKVSKARAQLIAKIKENKSNRWLLSTPSARGARRNARLGNMKVKLGLAFPAKGDGGSSSDAFVFTSPKSPVADPIKPSLPSRSPSATKPKSTKLAKLKAELKSKIKLSESKSNRISSLSFAPAVKQHKLANPNKLHPHPHFVTHAAPLARPLTGKFRPHPHFVAHPAPLVRPIAKKLRPHPHFVTHPAPLARPTTKFTPHPTFVAHPAPLTRPIVMDVDVFAQTMAGKCARDAGNEMRY